MSRLSHVVILGRSRPKAVAEALGCTPNVLLTQIGAGTHKRYVRGVTGWCAVQAPSDRHRGVKRLAHLMVRHGIVAGGLLPVYGEKMAAAR